ncbi:uncharacterized protein K460DRAFT_322427 [Cucurbitaria berberidis CBS 394.84]|uniref:Uncharacterized protein n=1 Tax=Cucurbitaria berberidis CBS 394.84 TaxID=1168544 RepID=A0A9P4L2X1_9PLEO|nr:uncharacterized protein K460DRAFT_322427 [Cucurbitaria berberidis CBS 394.84]KAF1840096.1 hypothetical protein K460DRAFT_322427 [Cucurbitaria berberidis CBS 394.84]
MAAAEVTWPSLVWSRHRQNDTANQTAEAHTPTWPAPLPTPSNSVAAQPQPNLYLQLSQILEWEIWNHNQTRAGLCSELTRRTELEAQIWKASHDLAQWQETCQTVYGALNEHREENANLKLDLEAATSELRRLKEQQQPCSVHHEATAAVEGEIAMGNNVLPKIEEAEEVGSWRLGFIRDIEQHFNDRRSV